jgi:hypothetical protein
MNRPERPRIVYIMGDGRSGSTVLAALLGHHPDIVSVGEIFHWPLFEGCPKHGNEKPSDLIFWNKVLDSYQKRSAGVSYTDLVDIQGEVENYSRFPRVWFGRIPGHLRDMYHNHALKLSSAICEASGKSILVDSSKRMGRAEMLLRNVFLDTKVIFLVRDPRGTMWSMMKTDVEQQTKPPITSMVHYWIKTLLCLLVSFRHRDRVLRIRYEDVVGDTDTTLSQIADFIGVTSAPYQEQVASGKPFQVGPLIDGNRVRQESTINVRQDDGWRLNLTSSLRTFALLMTLPFSLMFGYWGKAK